MNVYESINSLAGYGLATGLIKKEDVVYTKNRLLELFALDGFENERQAEFVPSVEVCELENILKSLLDYAVEKNFIEDSIVYRDLFDTKIMSCLVARPSEVQAEFSSLYKKSAKEATDWYYKFSQDTDYIRRYRVCKDLKWKASTEYGDIDITINLSKPEKDPKAIAAARSAKQGGYPTCLLCKENEGYAGRVNHAARQTHRIIPVELNGRMFGLQYSPYVYYNEHCIVFSYEHEPMKICPETFRYLFDFIKLFPHYIIGSNADLPIVGGSILSHNHFQGGNYEFPMAKAPVEEKFIVQGFEDAELHHIKKENIGLIEVMGLAVLPSRLKKELAGLEDAVLSGTDFSADEVLGKHYDWVKSFVPKYSSITKDNVGKILQDEVGIVFARVLEDAGVYKRNTAGKKAFEKFIKSL